MKNEPKTLQEAIQYFSNADNCLNYIVARRWPNGVVCPTCGSDKVAMCRRAGCGSARPGIPRASSRSRWEPSLRIPLFRSTSGSPQCGCSPTARTALALRRFSAQSASLRSPHGSCFTACGLRCKPVRPLSSAVPAVKLKWMKLSSAARLATCTRNYATSQDRRDWHRRQGRSYRHSLSVAARFAPL